MGFFVLVAIYIILAYYRTYFFNANILFFYIPTILFVDWAISLIANISNIIIIYSYLIWDNESLELLLSLALLH